MFQKVLSCEVRCTCSCKWPHALSGCLWILRPGYLLGCRGHQMRPCFIWFFFSNLLFISPLKVVLKLLHPPTTSFFIFTTVHSALSPRAVWNTSWVSLYAFPADLPSPLSWSLESWLQMMPVVQVRQGLPQELAYRLPSCVGSGPGHCHEVFRATQGFGVWPDAVLEDKRTDPRFFLFLLSSQPFLQPLSTRHFSFFCPINLLLFVLISKLFSFLLRQ